MATMIILLTVILLAAYTPASITVKIKSFITPTPKPSGDELIVYLLAEWEGKDALGLTVYTVRQWVEYSTNCTNIHWVTAWINSSGLPGYTFHSEITIVDQEWGGEGTLKAPRISPKTLQDNVGGRRWRNNEHILRWAGSVGNDIMDPLPNEDLLRSISHSNSQHAHKHWVDHSL